MWDTYLQNGIKMLICWIKHLLVEFNGFIDPKTIHLDTKIMALSYLVAKLWRFPISVVAILKIGSHFEKISNGLSSHWIS